MAEWRFGRGWSEAELVGRLVRAEGWPRSFTAEDERRGAEAGWTAVRSEALVAREHAGRPEPGGAWDLACRAVAAFRFSDPSIVVAHFRPGDPLDGRTILLELKVLGLRYLCGARITRVRRTDEEDHTEFALRYDTLAGHIEDGFEWFIVTKCHATGEVRFRIQARWRPGVFPNAWSRLGFHLLGPARQELWHRRAHRRLAALATHPAPSPRRSRDQGRLVHEGPPITFTRDEEATAWPA